MRPATLLIFWALSAFDVLPVAAQESSDQGSAAQIRTISHDQAIELASQRNLGLLIARMRRDVQEWTALQARQPYVPVLFLQPTYGSVSNTIVRPPQRTQYVDTSAGVRWDTAFGTSLALRAATTPWYRGFAPIPLTSLETSIGQPLLRGGWGKGHLLEVVDLEVELQRSVFVQQLHDLLVRVEQAYWELAYAQANVEISRLSRDRARQQFDDTTENIRRGLIAPGDIFVVEENLVIFEEQLLRAEERVHLASLRLGELLQLESGGHVVAADSLDEVDVSVPSVEVALDTAARQNPTIQAGRLATEQADIRLAYDRNQSRPVLDVTASLALNGLSEEYSEAWSETFTADNPAVRVGLYFELPLVGAPYRARVRRAELERREAITRLAEIETAVAFRVREIATQLETGKKALAFAQRRIELAEQKLQTEQDKYQRGLSTLNDVVRFQRDVDGARVGERRARLQVIVLRAELDAAQGILHDVVGLTVR